MSSGASVRGGVSSIDMDKIQRPRARRHLCAPRARFGAADWTHPCRGASIGPSNVGVKVWADRSLSGEGSSGASLPVVSRTAG